MNIKIQGLDELKASLGKYATQLPFAVSKAINETVAGAQQAAVRVMQHELHKPTPYIQKSVLYRKSTKKDLSASVFISEGGGDVLAPHIYGGARMRKASERRLRAFGFMRPDQWIVPAPGAPLDAYGNIPASQMQRILGWIGSYQEAGYSTTRKSNNHFVIKNVGVFKRVGWTGRKGIGKSSKAYAVPVLFFTSTPQYAVRYHFFEAVSGYINKNFPKNFAATLALAIKTAR